MQRTVSYISETFLTIHLLSSNIITVLLYILVFSIIYSELPSLYIVPDNMMIVRILQYDFISNVYRYFMAVYSYQDKVSGRRLNI